MLNGRVQPGKSVAIIGCGPIGLVALLTAKFYSPAEIIAVDLDDGRLAVAKHFGATAIEAVGVPATFKLCQQIVAAGGYRQHTDAADDAALASARPEAAHHALLQTRRCPRRLRDLCACGRDVRAQSVHRSLGMSAPTLESRSSHDHVLSKHLPRSFCATLLSTLGLTAFAVPSHATEEPEYQVIREIASVEVRQNVAYTVAEVVVAGPSGEAGSQAFPIQSGSIFGKN